MHQLFHVYFSVGYSNTADARKAQDVVDQARHAAGVVPHYVQHALAFVIQFACIVLQQHARKSVDGAQRRAQVMRNGVGKSFQFLVGVLQFGGSRADPVFQVILERNERELRDFLLGDVVYRAERAQRLAVLAVMRLASFVHVFHASVLHQQPVHDVVRRPVFNRFGIGAVHPVPVIGMDPVKESFEGRAEFFRIDFEDAVYLVRPGQHIAHQV